MSQPTKYSIEQLGTSTIPTPIELLSPANYVSDNERILLKPFVDQAGQIIQSEHGSDNLELAGPRAKIYFAPARTKVAIVTCGGVCPGLNAVIRALVMELWYRYGVKNIVGIPYGYHGLRNNSPHNIIELTPEKVLNIHLRGGTILGTSRGTPPVPEIVDSLEKYNFNILFAIGGEGTLKGANEIWEEIKARKLKLSVIGIPKTIDNDIPYVRQSFGFQSAVAVACQSVIAAHEEARSAERGIGLVKLMGRMSGHVAANTALATGDANFCLIPEVPFALEGDGGLLDLLEKRMDKTDHAVVIAAEGAGQYFFRGKEFGNDASGNKKLADIGVFLRDQINEYFKKKGKPVSLRYIDPSYIIRSTAPQPSDRLFCAQLATNAVHAAMAGKTGMLIGWWHNVMTHVPLAALIGRKRNINPHGTLWFSVLEMTGQPQTMGDVSKLF